MATSSLFESITKFYGKSSVCKANQYVAHNEMGTLFSLVHSFDFSVFLIFTFMYVRGKINCIGGN